MVKRVFVAVAVSVASCVAAPVGDDGVGEGEGDVGEGEGDAGEGEGEGEGDAGEGEGEGDAGEGEGEGEGEGDVDTDRYDVDGGFVFSTFSVDLDGFTEHLYLPDGDAAVPVVLLRAGTSQPAIAYDAYARRLASHGFLVLLRDDPGVLTRTPAVVDDLRFVLTEWLPAQHADAGSALFGRVDLSRVGVGGHSRGGKATLLLTQELPDLVDAYFGIDAVDVNFIDDGVYGITRLGEVTVPTVFLTAEVVGNCNPDNASGATYFAAAPSPSVYVLVKGAGHMQFEDADRVVFGSACTGAGTADDDVVHALGVRYVAAFFARELAGDDDVGASFAGAGADDDVEEGRVEIMTR